MDGEGNVELGESGETLPMSLTRARFGPSVATLRMCSLPLSRVFSQMPLQNSMLMEKKSGPWFCLRSSRSAWE